MKTNLTFRIKHLAVLVSLLSGLQGAHADWQLIDDFQSYETGRVNSGLTDGMWTPHRGTSWVEIAGEPDGNRSIAIGNKLSVFPASHRLDPALHLAAGDGTATYFMRHRFGEGTRHVSFGLAKYALEPSMYRPRWSDFLVQVNVHPHAETGEIAFEDGSNGQVRRAGELNKGEWVNFWLVVHRDPENGDTWDLYSKTGEGPAGKSDLLRADIGFRENQTDALATIILSAQTNEGDYTAHWDDIYFSKGENLAVPRRSEARIVERPVEQQPVSRAITEERNWEWLHGLSEEEAAEFEKKIPDEIEQGPFKPTVESLRAYSTPEWFRDAKFGIWVCYGPQAVPAGDGWYGRNMYLGVKNSHTQHYGHPSEFGFKDFIPMLRADEFDPDDLMRQFKGAGAKYFIALAVHHENFDLWDSQYHRWNAVNMGPKKDMIGMWRDAALKQGLRWGVTTHLARVPSWFQTSHREDEQGAFDGNNPAYQDFYPKPFPEDHVEYPANSTAAWRLEWFLRVRDLIDQYKPDLMYYDGSIPFRPDARPGLDIIAHLYNSSMKWHGGENQAVMNIKERHSGVYHEGITTLDLERAQLLDIREEPWQNDTSVGPWFYIADAPYKSADQVIHLLVDAVSKNGNMLLNVPMRAEGTIDDRAKVLLQDIGKWMDLNGEAIYGTRPWLVAGEDTAALEAEGSEKSTRRPGETAHDDEVQINPGEVRYTAKGDDTLYSIGVGWPDDDRIILRSLAKQEGSTAKVQTVDLVGHEGTLEFTHTEEGLAVTLPKEWKFDHAWALKIRGANLRDFDL